MPALQFSVSAKAMRAAAGISVVVAALAAWATLPKQNPLAEIGRAHV